MINDDGTPLSMVFDKRYETMKVLNTPIEIETNTAAPDTAADITLEPWTGLATPKP